MHDYPNSIVRDTENLGVLAMQFRGTRDESERQAIVERYAETVESLIENHSWIEIPAPEDQLPSDLMPKSFFEYWANQ